MSDSSFSVSSADFDGDHTLKYHRPHPFALYHGNNGAMVAYGQLMWRVDVIDFLFTTSSDGAGGYVVDPMDSAGQDAIKKLNVVIPKLNNSNGDPMDPTVPNVYHQLDGYGDVYLVWHMEFNESEIVTECFVEVIPEGGSGTTPSEAAAVSTSHTTFNRFQSVGTSSSHLSSYYRVKLGTVNRDELVQQDISSDVYWSFFLIERLLYG